MVLITQVLERYIHFAFCFLFLTFQGVIFELSVLLIWSECLVETFPENILLFFHYNE